MNEVNRKIVTLAKLIITLCNYIFPPGLGLPISRFNDDCSPPLQLRLGSSINKFSILQHNETIRNLNGRLEDDINLLRHAD